MGKHHFNVGITGRRYKPRGCLSCRRPIVYGDRCPDCERNLRLRRRRKPQVSGKRGPTGRPWRRLRARVLAASDLCVICGHPLAGDVHHLVPRSLRPDLELDPSNVAPAHGALSRCPWCNRACSSEVGDRLDLPAPVQSRRW